jgi:DNA-binding transcriptional ArsR family regulator
MRDRELVRALKALGHEKRLRMLRDIAAAGELTVGEVAEKFALSQPTISHHVKQLRSAGLLLSRPHGQTHYLSVDHALYETVLGALPIRVGQRRPPRPR